ncbi:uncharacterized protein [Macrobrachium rosenbergii]|uniref:uncharacterized protein n=1 Tax=Macrobrachium rosenbergii TaxID=79674 RepID=UPI0034D6FFE3
MAKAFSKYLLIQYADDSQILLSGKINDLQDLLNQAEIALKEAKTYFQVNGLNVNVNKTQCIFIGSRQLINKIPSNATILFDETHIKPSQTVKNLGVLMDQYMLFDHHINHVIKKVNGVLFFLNRIKDRFDKTSRLTVVESLVLSVINYCSKIWGMTTKEQIDRVQKAQNFAAKIAYGGARKYDHVTPILKELQWMNIETKILFDLCLFVYKICNHLVPDWLFKFPTVGDVQGRPTRQSSDLFVRRTTTDMGAKSISIKGPRVWNNIPTNIKNAPSSKLFKKILKSYLLENKLQ